MFCLIDRDANYVVGRIRDAVDALYAIDNGTLKLDQARDTAQRLELLIEEIFEYKATDTTNR